MDASTLPKGQSVERTDGRPLAEPGTYKHKPTGKVFITADGEEGVIQADALINNQSQKWGTDWERVGDVPSRVELHKQNSAKVAKLEAEEKAIKAKKAQAEADKQPAPGTGEKF